MNLDDWIFSKETRKNHEEAMKEMTGEDWANALDLGSLIGDSFLNKINCSDALARCRGKIKELLDEP